MNFPKHNGREEVNEGGGDKASVREGVTFNPTREISFLGEI